MPGTMTGPFLQRAGAGIAAGASPSGAVPGPALGLVETTSIARGVVVADAMVKKAVVRLAFARPVTPGKHVVVVTGEVAEVDEAMREGVARAAHTLVDRLLLPQVHEAVVAALQHGAMASLLGVGELSIGIVETFTVAAAIVGADAACKAAEVALGVLRLADGIGGKAYFVVGGELDMVEAAVGAAERVVEPGLWLGREIIARPHEDLMEALVRG